MTCFKLHLSFNLSRNNKVVLSNSYNPVADFSLKRIIYVRGGNHPPETVLNIHKLSPFRRDFPDKMNFPDFSKIGWSRFEIYSVNRDSWEDADEKGLIPFHPGANYRPSNFVVKDVPYWIGFDARDMTNIVRILGRIDPSTGLYKRLKCPEHFRESALIAVGFVNWKEFVAALVIYPGEYEKKMVDLYVLDENTEKWTKMYSIGLFGFKGMRTPQCFCTGEIVIETWSGGCVLSSSVLSNFCDPKIVICLITMKFKSYIHVGTSPTVT
ncbi:hypothetical protein AgCh_010227 [Apium graveolens]